MLRDPHSEGSSPWRGEAALGLETCRNTFKGCVQDAQCRQGWVSLAMQWRATDAGDQASKHWLKLLIDIMDRIMPMAGL